MIRDGLHGKLGGFTSLALRIEIRTGSSSRMTGRSWSSVKSVLTNSVKTCMAPWMELEEPDNKSWIRWLRRSGYSSGQSLFAIVDNVCA